MPDTRERIIAASSALFMQRGYAGSGLKQIATASEATIGSLYHFFPGGKEELAAETLRTSGATYQSLVEAILDSAPDMATAMSVSFSAAAAVLQGSDYADACPIATVALEVASSDEHLRGVIAEIMEAWLEACTRRFAAAGHTPERARQLAIVFVAALEGGFLLSRVAKNTEAMDAIGAALAELAGLSPDDAG